MFKGTYTYASSKIRQRESKQTKADIFLWKPIWRQVQESDIEHVILNRHTFQIMLNELIPLNKETNEKNLEEYIINNNVKFG